MLGASAVQIGTGLLRSPEAGLNPTWADAIGTATPDQTTVTRAFSGRRGRMLNNGFAEAAAAFDPLPYPAQAALTAPLKAEALAQGDIQRMQAFCGQSGGLAEARPAGEIVQHMWDGARALMNG